jgi:SagB-type dehydrogenase family enzyme
MIDAQISAAAFNHTMRKDRHPSVSGMGMRTQQFRFDNLSSPIMPQPAEDFLIASRLRRWDRDTTLSITNYFTDQMTVTRSKLDAEAPGEVSPIPLPRDRPITASLSDVVGRRRSIRRFSGDILPFADAAAILRHCGSVTAQCESDLVAGGIVSAPYRTVPSAGGLYPVEVWLVAHRVAEIDRGVYRYLPRHDALAFWADEEAVNQLQRSFIDSDGGIDLDRAAMLLLFLGRPWRSMRKYGARGMRFVFHEIGGIAQNAHLAVAGLGLGSTDFSSFYDDEANDALGVDGLLHALLHIVVIGLPR